jgi:hypothetical protein
MMGVGYTGGKYLPQYEVKEKFAWRPILTTSGKWVWWRRYTKLMKIYWGIAGEPPVIDTEFYTEGEWLLETMKNNYFINSCPPPDPFAVFKTKRKNKGP